MGGGGNAVTGMTELYMGSSYEEGWRCGEREGDSQDLMDEDMLKDSKTANARGCCQRVIYIYRYLEERNQKNSVRRKMLVIRRL